MAAYPLAALLVALGATSAGAGLPFRRGRAQPGPSALLLNKNDDLTTPVRSISISSSVLPRNVLRDAARNSGIHDAAPPADAAARLAASIDAWYRRNGYVFARVTARSPIRSGRLTLVVSEPRVAEQPVALTYYAAANGPSDTMPDALPGTSGDTAPPPDPAKDFASRWNRFRAQWGLRDMPAVGGAAAPAARAARLEAAVRRARDVGVSDEIVGTAEARLQALRRRAGLPSLGPLERMYAAGVLVAVGGSTREGVAARALHLRPGEPFRWDAGAWGQLRSCGLFEEAEARARFVPPEGLGRRPPPQPPQPKVKNGTVFVECSTVPAAEVHAPYPAAALPVERGGPPQKRGEERVSVVLSVVEKDTRPRKQSQHCRVEPGIALTGGRLAGELALNDHNLLGRNQQLKLDVSMRNTTELRASLHDPRLGCRFGWDARAFQRGIGLPMWRRGLWGGAAAEEDAAGADVSDGGAASATEGRSDRPTAGVDVSMSGRAWHGATVGFGASAEVVPTPSATPPRPSLLARAVGGGEASSGMASHETPLLLNANLGCGSLQGAGGSAGGRGPMQAGAKVSISRSLPFLTDACPDYWRLKGESRVTLPLGALVFKKEQQPMTAAPRPLPRWRRIGAPANAFSSDQLMQTVGRSPLLTDIGSLLRRGALSFKGRATFAADSTPLYEAEALGGDAAVRGYDDQELGRASSSVGASAELMVPLNAANEAQPIGLAFFTDVGSGAVRDAATGEMGKRVGSCAGVGVRYGPFRIDYAYNRAGRRKVHVRLVE